MAPDLARHWTLDPSVVFLNHGSFGACPRPVLAEQQALRERLEAEPVRFYLRELPDLMDAARVELARFVGADPEGLAFVPNATTGVNAVVRSMDLRAGDELLVTDHAYNACRNALEFAASRAGAKVTVARIPFPLAAPDEVVSAILDATTPRTRLVLVDHVTSPTAIRLPVERIVKELDARGIDALVDGAHAPGMIPLDLGTLGAAYYTGNCHKWLCAPKGAAFLHVRGDRRDRVRPHVISHGANAPAGARTRFRLEFDWTGTGDVTAYLSVPSAIRFLGGLVPGGWPEVVRRNRELALEGRRILSETLGPAPAPEAMIGSIASMPLADGAATSPGPFGIDPLQDALYRDHRIEVPVFCWPAAPRRWVRISAQLYNAPVEYRRLADALREYNAGLHGVA